MSSSIKSASEKEGHLRLSGLKGKIWRRKGGSAVEVAMRVVRVKR